MHICMPVTVEAGLCTRLQLIQRGLPRGKPCMSMHLTCVLKSHCSHNKPTSCKWASETEKVQQKKATDESRFF